jgi:hypothetical protein
MKKLRTHNPADEVIYSAEYVPLKISITLTASLAEPCNPAGV